MSARITVAPSKDRFLRDGKDFFLLIDTFWTALYNPSDEEWAAYLDYRRTQNYNAVQMNVIFQWDGGVADTGYYPFAIIKEGQFDYSKRNDAYFDHAEKRLEKAVNMGFTPVLILLHASYTPGTWATAKRPEAIMPPDVIESYIAYTVDRFKKYRPIYIVAGDTDLKNEVTLRTFRMALETTKAHDPEGLTCFHLTPDTQLPEEFASSDLLDFYMLQPGHRGDMTRLAYEMISVYYNSPHKKPVVNGEFYYEGHSYTQELYGRYNEFDQRKAIWQSVLAGSIAGIGYGAQGVWGWYRQGKEFANVSYGGKAYPWHVAMHFTGAWEGSFARYLFEQYKLYDLTPCDIILNDHPLQRKEIRAGITRDERRIAIYMPYGTDIEVSCDLSGYRFTMIEMTHKYFAAPVMDCCKERSVIRMPEFNSDVLFIGEKA